MRSSLFGFLARETHSRRPDGRRVYWNRRRDPIAFRSSIAVLSTLLHFNTHTSHRELVASSLQLTPPQIRQLTIQCHSSNTPPHRAWASITRSTQCQQDGSYREHCFSEPTVIHWCSLAGSRIGWLHFGGQSRERRRSLLELITMPCVNPPIARSGLTDVYGLDAKRVVGENRRQDPGRCEPMTTDLWQLCTDTIRSYLGRSPGLSMRTTTITCRCIVLVIKLNILAICPSSPLPL